MAATLAGVGMTFAPVDPRKALYWSAVIHGIISIPIMAVMMLMASRDVMGRLLIGRRLRALGWLCGVDDGRAGRHGHYDACLASFSTDAMMRSGSA